MSRLSNDDEKIEIVFVKDFSKKSQVDNEAKRFIQKKDYNKALKLY